MGTSVRVAEVVARDADTPISHRLNAERLLLAAWPRAILMQIAHPLIAAGVAAHSSFRQSPTMAARRLLATVHAMLSISFGDRAEQERALAGIRAIHRRVNGELAETVGPYSAGTRYSAEDPGLLLWVHVTLLESIVLAHDQLVKELGARERDEYVAEGAWVAVALGARDEDVPRSWDALRAYIDATLASGRIVVGPTARELAPAITATPFPLLTAPIAAVLRTVTMGWLPAMLREQYGVRWTPADARRAKRFVRALRRLRAVVPRPLAWWRDARR